MLILNSLNVSYIDPSSVSIVLSSIAGVAVAIGATFTILWRKAKKKVANVLHIDENANKEVEADLVVNDEELINDKQESVSNKEEASVTETTEENK